MEKESDVKVEQAWETREGESHNFWTESVRGRVKRKWMLKTG